MGWLHMVLMAVAALAPQTTTSTSIRSVDKQSPTASNIINMTSPNGLPIPTLSMVNIAEVGGIPVTEGVVDLIRHSCIFPEDNLLLRRLAYVQTEDGLSPDTYGKGYYGGIWKVDEGMLKATQVDSAALRGKFSAIQQAFGIDWPSVTWQDLQKPLYSGLAAALFAFINGPVPMSEAEQGSFVHRVINPAITPFNFTRLNSHLPVCDGRQKMDLVFALDSGTSDQDFASMRDFIRGVVEGVDGEVRVAVYQFDGSALWESLPFHNNSDPKQLSGMLGSVAQVRNHSDPQSSDVGLALTSVQHHAWYQATPQPLHAKMMLVLTNRTINNAQSLSQSASSQGVSVMVVGVGNSNAQSGAVSQPSCTHYLSVPDFQDLSFFTQLTQHAVCAEPMLARGMVHCGLRDCRNLAFPITSPATTLITNVTCGAGRVRVTTRMPRPGWGFDDFSAVVDSETGPAYVSVLGGQGAYLYADFFSPTTADPNCVVTLSTVNGIVGTSEPEVCEGWKYPAVNPCEDPNRGDIQQFAYALNEGMFIQCDLQNNMYLTKCPPGSPFFSASCHSCFGGGNRPGLSDCGGAGVASEFCGLPQNPCTSQNIQQGNYFFACPVNETQYLQCNNWGHAFVRQCREKYVWRQESLTCEYYNTDYNPCGAPGVRYYPYPDDDRYFIDCGADMVPALKMCPSGLVWNSAKDICDYPATSHPPLPLTTRPPVQVTHPPVQGSTPPHRPNDKISTDFAAPCTHSNVDANRLFWPYPGNIAMYIHCDPFGNAYLQACQPGYDYNPESHTCVDGPVIG